jgi:ectoine hydroxylase-related dioxygenase (phytanoyl-CoA dioxygenase family)
MLNDGTIVLRNVINQVTVAQFKLWATNPERYHRGNGVDGNYYGEHDGEREYDVWWTTQPPKEMWVPVVVQLKDPITHLFGHDNWDIHVVDCITTRPSSSKIYAHIDTPYRFEEFAQVDECLGVQIIIPLDVFTLDNGATAYLSGSSLEKIDYKDLEENRDNYNYRLVNEGQQFLSQPGDVLMYDGRTLHSTMPNKSTEFRSALLINALKSDIIPRVQELDRNTDFVKK